MNDQPDWINLRGGVVDRTGVDGPFPSDGRYMRVGELSSKGGALTAQGQVTSPAAKVIRAENGSCYIEWAAGADILDYAGSSLYTVPPATPAGVPEGWVLVPRYSERGRRCPACVVCGDDMVPNPPTAAPSAPAEVPDGCIPIHRALLNKLASDMDLIDMPKIGAAIRRWVANFDARTAAAQSAPEGDGGVE